MLAFGAGRAAADEPTPTTAAPPRAEAFDAAAAWTEFEQLVRDYYGYFERPGVDGPALLRTFEPKARAARTRAEFLPVLKVLARNFADPHFVVGPLDDTDPAVVPTGSDVYARCIDGRFVIADVRAHGDAARQGVRVGDVVRTIDGESPLARIESLLGRPATASSVSQIEHGLNVALAGLRNQRRSLEVERRGERLEFRLASTYEFANAIDRLPPLSVERAGSVGILHFNNSLGRDDTVAAVRAALDALTDTTGLVLDFRNTPSGGNTVVARGILGHFVDRDRPYQVHEVPYERRHWGVPRKFVEYVVPIPPHYGRPVVVLGGRWTGSMGEGMVIAFDALGITTVGSSLGHLLGAISAFDLPASSARIELGAEQLFHVDGRPREAFTPRIQVAPAEAGTGEDGSDPALQAALHYLEAHRRSTGRDVDPAR